MSQPEPAGLSRRLAAALVDVVATLGVLVVAWLLVQWGIGVSIGLFGLSGDLAVNALPFSLLGIVLVGPWLYWAGLEAWTAQGTIGKALLGIRVRTPDGQLPSFRRATRRYWLKALLAGPLLPVGLILFAAAGLSPRRRALWDVAAGTFVARGPERGLLYALPTSTLIIPFSTRTGKVSTGS